MKRLQILMIATIVAMAFTACKNADYKTTVSGLKYNLIDGGSKDSTKIGDVLKMNVVQKIEGSKDTVLYSSYGKMPAFQKVQEMPAGPNGKPYYGPEELFKNLKKGDSLISVLYVDSLITKGLMMEAQMPPFMKKGDKIITTFKVLEVFKNDSLANADYQKEQEKDAPRAKKEQEEMMKKYKAEAEAKQKAEYDSLKKIGVIDRQNKEVADYLSKKGVTGYITTPLGTYVKINNPGTGPAVADGKFVTVKYNGKHLNGDSSFQNSSFTTEINGPMASIKGFEDGLKQFKEGGKGVIYIPGYLAYGSTPPPGSPFKPFEPLYFEVEIQKVSDTEPVQPAPTTQPAQPDSHEGHGH